METQKEDSIKEMLAGAFASVLPPKSAVYAVVPVTSGLRLWRLAKDLKISDLGIVSKVAPNEYESRVILPNCTFAGEFAENARKRYGLVVDPSRLMIPEWSQKQYWLFWEEIILRYVSCLLLSPEWAYSKGCVYECIFAVQNRIPVFSSEGTELRLTKLREIVSIAMRDRSVFAVEADFLDEFMASAG